MFKSINYPVTTKIEEALASASLFKRKYLKLNDIVPIDTRDNTIAKLETVKEDGESRSKAKPIDHYSFVYVKDKVEHKIPSSFFRTTNLESVAYLMNEIYTVNKISKDHSELVGAGFEPSPFGRYEMYDKAGNRIDILAKTKGDSSKLTPKNLETISRKLAKHLEADLDNKGVKTKKAKESKSEEEESD